MQEEGFVTLAIIRRIHDQHQGIGHGGSKPKGRVLVEVWRRDIEVDVVGIRGQVDGEDGVGVWEGERRDRPLRHGELELCDEAQDQPWEPSRD